MEKKEVHAHFSLQRDPCAVTSDDMTMISTIYLLAYYGFYYRLHFRYDLPCKDNREDHIFDIHPLSNDFCETAGHLKKTVIDLL